MDKKIEYWGHKSDCKIELSEQEMEILCIRMAEALCVQLFRDGQLSTQEKEAIHANVKKLEENIK